MEENNYKKGITLIEVLTSLFIIVVLSTIAFFINRQTNRQYNLLRSANELAQSIRLAQQMAMTTSKCPVGTACAGNIPEGYGIFLNDGNANYLLYADIDGSEDYNGGDVTIGTIDFENGVIIDSIQTISPLQDVNSLSINFKPPDPATLINGDQAIDGGTIVLALQSSSKTKIIKINKSGLIWIE